MNPPSKANPLLAKNLTPDSASASGHDLDSFLDGLSRLASSTTSRETFYRTLVAGLPMALDDSACGVGFAIAGQWVPAFSSCRIDEPRSLRVEQLQAILASHTPENAPSAKQIFVSRTTGGEHCHFVSTAALDERNRFAFWLTVPLRAAEPASGIFEDLVEEIARQIIEFEQRLLLQEHERRTRDLKDLTSMLLSATEARNLSQAAYGIVNDLAQFTQADRVCLFDQRGKPRACSGVAQINARSRTIHLLSSLARAITRHDRAIVYRRSIEADQPLWIQSPLEQVRTDWNPVALTGVPLRAETQRLGALTFEYLEGDEVDWIDKQRRIETATSFLMPIYGKVQRLERAPVLRPLGWFLDSLRTRPLRLATVGLIVVGLALAAYWGLARQFSSFEIAATGTLAPQNYRVVFSPELGTVDELMVREGQVIAEGDLVAVIRSDSLTAEITKAEGEMEEALEQLRILELADVSQMTAGADVLPEVERARIASELKRQRIRVETIQESLGHLRDRAAKLKVYAPAGGIVTTRKVETSLLHRPVSIGDELITIADQAGPWEVILEIDQRRVAYVLESLQAQAGTGVPVRMRLSSAPTDVVGGSIRQLDFMARDSDPQAASKVVRAYVEVDEAALGARLRIGTRVDGRIQCGERNWWFILTHELRDKVREYFFF